MRVLDTGRSYDATLHLAVEEWCVRHLDLGTGVLFTYVNDPCVVVGKNQNVYEEVDLDWARRRGVPIVRRLSGGGTVYHDRGNLNICVLRPYRPGTKLDFAALIEPIAAAVRSLGVPIVQNDRNDLMINANKVSGNAHFTTVRSMFTHATLLFDADLDDLRSALRVDPTGIRSRAPKSVRSSVTNLVSHLDEPAPFERFHERLVERLVGVFASGGACGTRVGLDDAARSEIEQLANERYRTWEWTFGRAPRFTIERRLSVGAEPTTVRLEIERGVVSAARVPLGGDRRRLGHVLAQLAGARYRRDDLANRLRGAGVEPGTDGADAETMAGWLHP